MWRPCSLKTDGVRVSIPGGRDIYYLAVLVSPAMAQWILDHYNTFNRDIRQSWVNKLVAEMRDGAWQLSPEGASFDEDENVIDGQHRLTACVKADMSAWMMFSFGWEQRVRKVMGGGAVRQTVESLWFGGLELPSDIDKRRLNALLNSFISGTGSKGALTRSQTEKTITTYRRELMFVCKLAAEVSPRMRSAVLAALARAYLHGVDGEKLRRFLTILTDGVSSSDQDRVVIMLRDFLRDEVRGFNNNQSAEVYGKTARALQAYLRGESLQRLYRVKEDPFPLLDDSGEDDSLVDLVARGVLDESVLPPRVRVRTASRGWHQSGQRYRSRSSI